LADAIRFSGDALPSIAWATGTRPSAAKNGSLTAESFRTMPHFLNLMDQPTDLLRSLLTRAAELKANGKAGTALAGKVVGLVFEKPSLRTRVSFEAAVAQLGGTSLFFPGNEIGLGWREPLSDFARVMSRYIDCLVLRVFRHETVDALAKHGTIPVVNGLSDRSHPCQAVADFLTMHERIGGVEGKTVAFIGDANNVSMSLAVGCGKLGAKFVLACPKGYSFDEPFLKEYEAKIGEPMPAVVHDPAAAVKTADVIYTDVWTSMGQEAERETRLRKFAKFQVNEALLAKAPPHCLVLHCLPAHRGEEITEGVLEGKCSGVFDQAENRLHAQKAILEWLLK
jgi:ornithine carbamoyltransferase